MVSEKERRWVDLVRMTLAYGKGWKILLTRHMVNLPLCPEFPQKKRSNSPHDLLLPNLSLLPPTHPAPLPCLLPGFGSSLPLDQKLQSLLWEIYLPYLPGHPHSPSQLVVRGTYWWWRHCRRGPGAEAASQGRAPGAKSRQNPGQGPPAGL